MEIVKKIKQMYKQYMVLEPNYFFKAFFLHFVLLKCFTDLFLNV